MYNIITVGNCGISGINHSSMMMVPLLCLLFPHVVVYSLNKYDLNIYI